MNTNIQGGDGTIQPSILDITGDNNKPAGQAPAGGEQQQQQAAGDGTGAPDPNKPDPNAPDPNKPAGDASAGNAGEGEGGDEGDDEGDIAENFWAEINTLRGSDLDIDFTGIDDKLSAAAILALEKAARIAAVTEFDERQKVEDPKAYAYKLHRMNGGSDEEFFTSKTRTLPTEDALLNDIALQKQFLKDSMISKGIKDTRADAIVKLAAEEGTLAEEVKAEFKAQQTAEKQLLADIEASNKEAQAEFEAEVIELTTVLSDTVMKAQDLTIKIPETKKAEFLSFMQRHIVHDVERGFNVALPLADKTAMSNIVQAMYLLYAKGDIAALVDRKAKTQRASALRSNYDKQKSGDGAQSGNPKPSTQRAPGVQPALGELFTA